MAKKNKALRRKSQPYAAPHHHQKTNQKPTRWSGKKKV